MRNSILKWICSFLVVAFSVLIFGGVDLWAQVLVMVFLTIGLWSRSIRMEALPSYLWKGFTIFFLVLIVKEILPASWFSSPHWRVSFEQDFGATLSSFHHPELGRFFQLFMGALAIGLVGLWWKSFSDVRALRIHLAWTGFVVILIAALLSFSTRGSAIFGIRETVGYDGFGPFPNRNHTGALFGIGIFF